MTQASEVFSFCMDPPLPPGWAAARDPASGRTYFYEHATRRTAWARPAPASAAEPPPPGVERAAGPAAPAHAPRAGPGPAAAAPRAAEPPAPAAAAATRAGPTTRRHRLAAACTFVVAPGASGAGFCHELMEALGRLGHATEVAGWHGAYAKDAQRNCDRLARVVGEAALASGPQCRVLLVGDGFGGRVVCRLLARWAEGDNPPANAVADAAVLVGYPLYGATPPRGKADDRVGALAALPSSTRLLFVSGERDEFLNRTRGGTAWRDAGAPRGVAALRAAAADLPCAAHACVVGVENTGQQPLRAGRKRTEPAKALVLRALEPFVDALAGAGAARAPTGDPRKRLRAASDDSSEGAPAPGERHESFGYH